MRKWLSGLPTKISGYDYDRLQVAIFMAVISPRLKPGYKISLVVEWGGRRCYFAGVRVSE